MTGQTTTIGGRIVATARGPIEVITQDGAAGATPLLLIHGMSGDARQGLPLIRRLGGDNPVIAVSRPGYGSTPLASGRGANEQADLYAAVLDLMEIDRVVAIGISAGGPSTLMFAIRHPDRCAGLVQLCAVVGHLIKVPTAMRVVAKVPPLWNFGAVLQSRATRNRDLEEELTATERSLVRTDPSVEVDLREFQRQASEGVRSVRGMRADVAMFEERRRAGAPHWPDQVRIPAEIVHGSADVVVPPNHASWHGQEIPGARVTMVPDVGHVVPLTGAHVCVDAIRRVLAH